jgi:hypothetical protein
MRPNPNHRPKAFASCFQYSRSISTPLSTVEDRSMERPTTEQLETMREIDDLNSSVSNLRRQLDFANQQLRMMRIRVNRYEAILGMDEQEAA